MTELQHSPRLENVKLQHPHKRFQIKGETKIKFKIQHYLVTKNFKSSFFERIYAKKKKNPKYKMTTILTCL